MAQGPLIVSNILDIPAGLETLSFRHLQLHPKYVERLESLGISCLRDMNNCSAEQREDYDKFLSIVKRHLILAKSTMKGRHIDWIAFWSQPGIHVHWLAMHFNKEDFNEPLREILLDSLKGVFGPSMNIPLAQGLQSFGELISTFEEGTLPWPGFGATKISRLGTMLQAVANNPNIIPSANLGDKFKLQSNRLDSHLPEYVLSWDIKSLGLGGKTKILKKLGFTTVRSLLDNLRDLPQSPSVGRSTITKIEDCISTISSALIDGQLDLSLLAEAQGREIFPHKEEIPTGQLANIISEFVKAVASEDGSQMASLIAENRICKAGTDAATLESLARMATQPITRERVRQIERKVLHKITVLLISPFPIMGNTVVRSALKKRFQSLSYALSEREEIGPTELGFMIAKEWHCSVAEAFSALPIVMAIIEGTARSSADLRRLADSPEPFLRTIEGTTGSWSTQNIGAERGLIKMLNNLGITTLEKLRVSWIEGQEFRHYEAFVRSALSAACSDSSSVHQFSEKLAHSTQRILVPAKKNTWSDYVSEIRADVSSLITEGTFWSDAQLIFDDRTSTLPNERQTTERLGKRLGRMGVTVKQTETQTLERLALALLYDAGGYVQCILRSDWLDMWQEMKKIYDRFPGDQRTFRRSIEEIIDLNEETLTIAMPTIWAILSGLPTRKIYGKSKVESNVPATLLAPVKLTGFRTLH